MTGESSEAKDDNSVAEESGDNWDVSSACQNAELSIMTLQDVK